MSSIGQTREHALLAFTLGIKNIIVCVNKMDNYYVNYASVVYDHVKKEVLQFLKKVGFKTETIPVIPISGWVGDNLVKKSSNIPYYHGPTLIEALDNIEPPKRATDKPLRIPLSDVYKIGGIGTIPVGKI